MCSKNELVTVTYELYYTLWPGRADVLDKTI